MPASLFAGAVFLMLTDLLARTVIAPVELPIGVVTSLIGAVTFAAIFRSTRKGGKHHAVR
jgi:iron complex transport system permease protein